MLTIVYRSEASSLLPFPALVDICMQSARANKALGITGFLIEFQGIFLQVLEGEPEATDALYARIASDPRHGNVERLIRERRDGRRFGFWAMNLGPLNNTMFWRGVFGTPMEKDEFRERSQEPAFAFDVLSRAYLHACVIADVDPACRDFISGHVPQRDHIPQEP